MAPRDSVLGQHDSVLATLLAPLAAYLDELGVTEVCVNRPGELWIEGRAGWRREVKPEVSLDALMRLAKVIASTSGQVIDETRPLLSATLPTGERVQLVCPPAVPAGQFSLTIRKPSTVTLGLTELDQAGLFTGMAAASVQSVGSHLADLYRDHRWAEFLAQAVQARRNIIISGATGSGKTTLSKALIAMIPAHERIITIEDTLELVVPQPNHVRLVYSKGSQGISAVGPRELLEACLRMRPDRILLQELRDGTAFYYLRTVNSGHPGSITTVHADSAALAFEQLTLLVKESEGGRDLARDDIRHMLRTLVDIVVQVRRINGQFRVTEIDYPAAR